MGKSKIIFGGEVLIDLTADTVTADNLLKGFTAHGKDGEPITGACTFDSDTTGATATAAEILATKTAYVKGLKVTGTMKNNAAVTGTIATKTGQFTIPQGYHDGSGKVSIDVTEQAKIIPENIRDGVTMLGVLGVMSGSEDVKSESKTVTPTKAGMTVLPDSTQGYNYLSQVVVAPIPYSESENSSGGTTVTIA